MPTLLDGTATSVDASRDAFHAFEVIQSFNFTAELWLNPGHGGWHFLTLPEEVGAGIRFFSPQAKGFMPIPVKVKIGQTTWKTSVFPDSKSGSYLLAVKSEVRKKQGLAAGDDVEVSLLVL